MSDCNMTKCPIHDEVERRMDDEHKRINKRLGIVERLTSSIESMAFSMKHMEEDQKNIDERLKVIEGRDGDKWRKVTETVVLCFVTAIVGFVLAKIGF